MDLNKIPNLEDFQESAQSLEFDDPVLPLKEIAEKLPKTYDRFKTGFRVFDEAMSGGFKEGDLVIVSGLSGEGKTSICQTFTYHLTAAGIPCLWFSYEVSVQELHRKFEEMDMAEHYEVYHPKKTTTGKLEWLEYKIKESWRKYATKVVFIDHIDYLMPRNLPKGETREMILKQTVIELKSLAIDLGMVIVLPVHLKKIENNREPDMQDIGYSAGIYQNADYVFMIYREKQKHRFDEVEGDISSNNTILKIVKNRQTGQNKFIKCAYANGLFRQLDKRINPIPERIAKF